MRHCYLSHSFVAFLFIWKLALCSAPAFAGDAAWPEIPMPPKSHVYRVGNDIRLNGVSMRIQRFTSDMNMADLLAFYRNQWTMQDHRNSIESESGVWRIIGRRDERYYLTVQVTSIGDNRSGGYLAVSRLPLHAGTMKQPIAFPAMAGSEKVSDLESTDPGKIARTLMFINRFSTRANADFYRNRLSRDGWRIDGEKETNIDHENAQVIFLSQENKELMLTVSSRKGGPGSIVVLSLVTEGR